MEKEMEEIMDGWLECDVSVLITASSFLTLVCASVSVAVAVDEHDALGSVSQPPQRSHWLSHRKSTVPIGSNCTSRAHSEHFDCGRPTTATRPVAFTMALCMAWNNPAINTLAPALL
jgi:hypothetical protein